MFEEIPASVRTLVSDAIHSHHELNVLLALSKSPDERCRSRRLSRELGLSLEEVERALRGLVRRDLVDVSGAGGGATFRYRPPSTVIEEAVTELHHSFAANPLPVMRLVNANAVARMRTGAARVFTDKRLSKPGDSER